MDVGDHPLTLLRRRLEEDFFGDLPDGVHRVDKRCREPQFFPGATGLLTESSWSEVIPGRRKVEERLPPAPRRGILVLGNYQATLASYQRILDQSIGGFPTTWRVLRQLLYAVNPREVFLTNAYIGLPDLARDTAPFPKTPSFVDRCQRLLELEIELFDPRLIVCLGVAAAKMLASVTENLTAWTPWPGYRALRSNGLQTVPNCRVNGIDFGTVAVQHPSAVLSNAQREIEASLIAAAA